MARRQRIRPYEVAWSAERAARVGGKWLTELTAAMEARSRLTGPISEIDATHTLYEGGDTTLTKTTPWVGAANLTSFIGTEKVDAWRARLMQIIFTEPIWIVEGWGTAAPRALLVEEFHQWKAEEERLQVHLGKTFHNAFIEGTGVLEVAVKPQPRVITQSQTALVDIDPRTGQVLIDPATGTPQVRLDAEGLPLTIPDDQAAAFAEAGVPTTRVDVETVVNVADGPSYRVISLRDFVYAPGTANHPADVYGYGKRFYVSLDELQRQAALGLYDAEAVARLGPTDDRIISAREQGYGLDSPGTTTDRSLIELWEWLVLEDLDDDGLAEWYVSTLSLMTQQVLRVQKLRIGRPTYLLFTPFPRSDSLYGYSLVSHKLGTLIDEHSALRNMIADRSALKNSAPILRVVGSLWDELEQPFGPRAIIDVRDVNELRQMDVADVPGSLIERERNILAAGERVSGLNDTALGVHPQVDRTLGEVQTVTAQSFVRLEEAIRYLQEPMEQLFGLRHEIYRQTLRDQGPMLLPPTILAVLSGRGVVVETPEVTAETLTGIFRGKPRGSVETADPNRRRADFTALIQALAQLAQSVPMVAQMLSTPQAQKALLDQAMYVFNWRNKQAFTLAPSALGFAQVPPLVQGVEAGATLPSPASGGPSA
jgi:hypothetical protein